MSHIGLFIDEGESRLSAWLPAIAIAGLFHVGIVSLGFLTPHANDHLNSVELGEQAANDPPAPAGEYIDVEWAPEITPEPEIESPPEPQPVEEPLSEQEPLPEPVPDPAPPIPIPEPVSEPVTQPDFVEPVKPAPPPPAPKKIVEPPRPAKTTETKRPKTTAPQQKSPASRSTTRGTPDGVGPAHSAGTNPKGKGNPDSAPSSVIVGNKNYPRPPYPLQARQKGQQGTVIVRINVSGGQVTKVSIVRSSGHPILDSTASRHIKATWKFPPGVTGTLNQPIQFNIRS